MSALPSGSPSDTKDAAARRLAKAHREADPDIKEIYRIEAPGQEANPTEPVKLLEISPNTSTSGIVPIWLTPYPKAGIFFPSVIVEVHPSEVTSLRNNVLALPNGWRVDWDHPL